LLYGGIRNKGMGVDGGGGGLGWHRETSGMGGNHSVSNQRGASDISAPMARKRRKNDVGSTRRKRGKDKSHLARRSQKGEKLRGARLGGLTGKRFKKIWRGPHPLATIMCGTVRKRLRWAKRRAGEGVTVEKGPRKGSELCFQQKKQ